MQFEFKTIPMHKKYFILFLLTLVAIHSQAQIVYKDFIQTDQKIQWASQYAQVFEITPRIRKFGVKQYFIDLLRKKGCIKNYLMQNDDIKELKYCLTDSITKRTFLSTLNPYKKLMRDADPQDPNQSTINEKPCNCISSLAKNRLDIYKLDQIMYYKNAEFFIKNILVTPLSLQNFTRDTLNNPLLTWEESLSTCLNTGEVLPKNKNQYIDLGSYEQVYNLMFDIQNKKTDAEIFTLKDPVLSRHLFEDLFKNRISAIDDRGNLIPSKKITSYNTSSIEVPVYDSMGNFLFNKRIYPEINIDSIYEFGINQHFYFDTLNRIVYSEVNYINVYHNIISSTGIDLGRAIYFRIYFVQPSLYKKPKNTRFLN